MRQRRRDVVVVAATLAAAAATRFARLDLMEFKGDEANACRLALHVLGYHEPGVGTFFPTAGLGSSIGIPNPPLFVYLMALPLAIVRSPLAAATFVGTLNVVAVWLTYVVGKRLYSRFVGAASASMLALSPWGIVFSRKIWAQDLLPLFTTLFILQLHALVVERRPRAAVYLIVLTAAALQVHFSAFVLVPVAVLALVVARKHLDWRWVAAGLVVTAALYAPYLALHSGAIVDTALHHRSYAGPGPLPRLEAGARLALGIVGGGGMAYLIGRGSAFATGLSLVLGCLAPAGLVAEAWRRRGPQRTLDALLLLWYTLPLAFLTALAIHPYMHYMIALLPLPYLGVASAIERVARRRARLPAVAVALILCSFAVLDGRFFRTIIADGGAPGDYGVAYRFKAEAVALVLRDAAGRPFAVSTSPSFQATRDLRPYRFLIWNSDLDRRVAAGSPPLRYLLVSRFRRESPLLRRELAERAHPQTRLGPITVVRIVGATYSHGTVASPHSKQAQAAPSATAWTAAATVSSTPRSTGSQSPKPATTQLHAPTSNGSVPRARAAVKRSAASNDSSSASSSTH